MSQIFADRSLSVRLERAECLANSSFVEARAKTNPELGAQWIEVAGARAMFDGPVSPCTQTFGLGMARLPTDAEMGQIEEFFKDRGAPIMHEVSPLADKALPAMLAARGYHPVELTSVMYCSLDGRRRRRRPRPSVAALISEETIAPESVRVRIVEGADCDVWARTMAEGWREVTEFSAMIGDLAQVMARRSGSALFLADLDHRPIAAAALSLHEGVALFAGGSTIPEWRRRGAQNALFEDRMQHAIDAGCDLAMVCAEPGSSSQRNAERRGFRIAYTRIKWGLAPQ